MTGIFLFFMIILFFVLFLPALMYILPVLLIIWLVSALVNSFRGPRATTTRTYYYTYGNPNADPYDRTGQARQNPEIPKRQALPDSIDAEYTEVEVSDEPDDPQ